MKKQVLTAERIKEDVIRNIGATEEISASQYKKWTVAALVIGILMYVIEYFHPSIIVGASVCVIAAALLLLVAAVIRIRYRKKHVCMDDYEITTEKLVYKNEEHYLAKKTLHTSREVNNYDLYFANGKSWRIPEKVCLQSTGNQLSAYYIYDNARRDDQFTVVSKKDTGEIVAAYPARFFVYCA